MPSIPSDFVSTTFVDPEQLTDVKIYTRILQVINSLFAWARALPVIQHGTATAVFSSASAVNVTVVFPVAFSAIPDVTCDVQPITSNTPVTWGISALSTTGFTLRVNTVSGGSVTASLTVHWIAAN